ncbi:hypothetical protein SAMN04487866_10143 [Thermoactinomyces sp. DSM 45891]|uniref:hypothetical protein n=1 Tax=Thermoactinomyces sp. DSM 45891 TaxID=1761907 RepID=UPI00091612CC|nr:hypothetical protein [Thermoactinomyces sp. DSM 45891]SFW98213.1 hypothetical protein SAMN04487866_10143 [Thermoactinomyces sp. DSM 45891]
MKRRNYFVILSVTVLSLYTFGGSVGAFFNIPDINDSFEQQTFTKPSDKEEDHRWWSEFCDESKEVSSNILQEIANMFQPKSPSQTE